MSKSIFFTILIFTLTIFSTLSIKVDIKTQNFVDELGRYRFYHGVNAIYKKFPFVPVYDHFHPNNSLAAEDFQNLNKWGLNVIRFYVPWEGLEPKQGEFNYTLLNEIHNVVKLAEQYNISIILDAHQDLLAKQFCGEGFPEWTIKNYKSFPSPISAKLERDSQGYPTTDSCLDSTFSNFYFSWDLAQAFSDLYENKDNIADQFANMWKIVANQFKNQSNVLGYELLNEPFYGNIYKNPLLLWNADQYYLQPFYKKLHNAIREVDNQKMLFFEPNVMEPLYNRLTEGPGGIEYNDRQVFSYHLYCMTDTKNTILNLACKYIADSLLFNVHIKNAKSLGTGMFLTEFGALYNSSSEVQEIDRIMNLVESNFQSWAYWQFKYFEDITTTSKPGTSESLYDINGNIQENKVKILARSYVYAVSGVPLNTGFDSATGQLQFSKIYKKSDGNTELYLSEDFYYQNGFSIKFSNNCQNGEKCKLNKIREKYYYELVIDNSLLEQEISITIIRN